MKNLTHLLLFISVNVSAQDFITTWKTDIISDANNGFIELPVSSGGGTYDVDWGDGTTETGLTGREFHSYSEHGTYIVSVDFTNATSPTFGSWNASGSNYLKLISIDQWGGATWGSMEGAFEDCSNMNLNATDAPDLSAVTDMSRMFKDASMMNADLDHWDVSNVQLMDGVFWSAEAFNGDISTWDVSSVTNMDRTFVGAISFAGDISEWDVSSVQSMEYIFSSSSFNGDISDWDVSKVESFDAAFIGSSFNGDISSWDVSIATDMSDMFNQSSFNQDIGEWNTGNVETMSQMFYGTSFNQDISGWDVSSVTDFYRMFYGAVDFNQDLSMWDVSTATNLSGMFSFASSFTGGIGSWDISSATLLRSMFAGADSFDWDILDWDVSSVTSFDNFIYGFDAEQYDALLSAWAQLDLVDGIFFTANDSRFSLEGLADRMAIETDDMWTFNDAGFDFTPSDSISFSENSTETVADLGINDGTGTGTDNEITYSFSDDNTNDNSLFTLDSNTGEIAFLSAPDFETPTDEDLDNTYELYLSILIGEQTISNYVYVEVINVNESPFLETLIEDVLIQLDETLFNVNVNNYFDDPDADDEFSIEAQSDNTDVVTVTVADESDIVQFNKEGTGKSTITITVFDSGELSASDEFEIYINGDPIIIDEISTLEFDEGFGSETIDLSTVFSDTEGEELTYSWGIIGSDIIAVDVADGILTITEVGIGEADVVVAATDGLGGEVTLEFTVVVNEEVEEPLSLNDSNSFIVYPNPTSSYLNIDLTEPSIIALIYSLNGKLILSLKPAEKKLDVSKLESGQYILRVYDGEKLVGTDKILKIN